MPVISERAQYYCKTEMKVGQDKRAFLSFPQTTVWLVHFLRWRLQTSERLHGSQNNNSYSIQVLGGRTNVLRYLTFLQVISCTRSAMPFLPRTLEAAKRSSDVRQLHKPLKLLKASLPRGLTSWSFLEVTSCRKSATPFRPGILKPHSSKNSRTRSRGPK
jgi:hypothetical protein